MDKLTVEFEVEKSTPGTVKFKEIVPTGRQRGIVGSIYVLKTDLDKIGNPSKLTVTIAAKE